MTNDTILTADDATEASLPSPTIGVATPRTRWAGIVWGLVLAAIAGTGIWYLSSPASNISLTPWLMTLTPFSIVIYLILAVAALAVIGALVVLLRHAQKSFSARRARS